MNASAPAGTPAHPPVAHVVVGGYVVSAILDLLSLAVPGDTRDLYLAGGYTMMISTGALFAAALAGFIDRARRTAPGTQQRRAAGRHAVVAGCTGALAIADIVVRRHVHPDAIRVPLVVFALTLLVVLFVTLAGHLGGRLVFHDGVGVRRTP